MPRRNHSAQRWTTLSENQRQDIIRYHETQAWEALLATASPYSLQLNNHYANFFGHHFILTLHAVTGHLTQRFVTEAELALDKEATYLPMFPGGSYQEPRQGWPVDDAFTYVEVYRAPWMFDRFTVQHFYTGQIGYVWQKRGWVVVGMIFNGQEVVVQQPAPARPFSALAETFLADWEKVDGRSMFEVGDDVMVDGWALEAMMNTAWTGEANMEAEHGLIAMEKNGENVQIRFGEHAEMEVEAGPVVGNPVGNKAGGLELLALQANSPQYDAFFAQLDEMLANFNSETSWTAEMDATFGGGAYSVHGNATALAGPSSSAERSLHTQASQGAREISPFDKIEYGLFEGHELPASEAVSAVALNSPGEARGSQSFNGNEWELFEDVDFLSPVDGLHVQAQALKDMEVLS